MGKRGDNRDPAYREAELEALHHRSDWSNEYSPPPIRRSKLCSFLNYPIGVYFMFGNEFCERFSFYGMRAILTIYMIYVHQMEASTAKTIYHLFITICYFSPIFGSTLADGFFGRYRVILYVSICYCIGHGFLTFGAIPSLGMEAIKVFDFIGLFIIALSTGGIKPCVSAFAADQFPPSMKKEREQFFSYFYFTINAGAFLSILVTPILRHRVKCFGLDHCFPLAFGVPAILMTVATVIFISGHRFYTIVPRSENIIGKVFRCIGHAIKKRSEIGSGLHSDWLDYSKDKYGKALVDDIKGIFRILILFIPVIFFWALADQQGSTWVLQANQLDGRIGSWTVLPDQITMLNPLLILLLVPTFEIVIYPIFHKCGLFKTALQKMGFGGIMAAMSFILIGFIQLSIDEQSSVRFPAQDYSRYTFMNLGNETLYIQSPAGNLSIKGLTSASDDIDQFVSWRYQSEVDARDLSAANLTLKEGRLVAILPSRKASGSENGGDQSVSDAFSLSAIYKLAKSPNGNSSLLLVIQPGWVDAAGPNVEIVVRDKETGVEACRALVNESNGHFQWLKIQPSLIGSGEYEILLDEGNLMISASNQSDSALSESFKPIGTFRFGMGGVYAVALTGRQLGESPEPVQVMELIKANTVSLLAQVPAYFLMVIGEIMFSIPGLEFSYSQAAPSMKSVLQAIWLLTIAFGNLIDMLIAVADVIQDPAIEFFFYAGLMVVVMVLFIVLASRYKYVDRDAAEAKLYLPKEMKAVRGSRKPRS